MGAEDSWISKTRVVTGTVTNPQFQSVITACGQGVSLWSRDGLYNNNNTTAYATEKSTKSWNPFKKTDHTNDASYGTNDGSYGANNIGANNIGANNTGTNNNNYDNATYSTEEPKKSWNPFKKTIPPSATTSSTTTNTTAVPNDYPDNRVSYSSNAALNQNSH